jgi:hypothetical protein
VLEGRMFIWKRGAERCASPNTRASIRRRPRKSGTRAPMPGSTRTTRPSCTAGSRARTRPRSFPFSPT